MESTKFPKSDFKGKISNLADVDFSKDGMYKAKVTGNLTMHGVTQPATADAIITVKGGKISASSKFKVKLNDYKIERPAVVADKISDTIEISVDAAYEPKK
jgi:polyisoprenoid-binding protein YceI